MALAVSKISTYQVFLWKYTNQSTFKFAPGVKGSSANLGEQHTGTVTDLHETTPTVSSPTQEFGQGLSLMRWRITRTNKCLKLEDFDFGNLNILTHESSRHYFTPVKTWWHVMQA
jgi:hypothetical protein